MIKITDYIQVYKNILAEDICNQIISDNLFFERATLSDKTVSKIRNCYDKRLDEKYDKAIYKSVSEILIDYSKKFKYFGNGLLGQDTGYTHLLYKGSEQGEYKEHCDHYYQEPRVLSCSIILNDNYDGGDFSFFGNAHTVKKIKCSAVVFPSSFCFPHAVTPVSNGDRHSIITWIR